MKATPTPAELRREVNRLQREVNLLREQPAPGDLPDDWMIHDGLCHSASDISRMTVDIKRAEVSTFVHGGERDVEAYDSAGEAITAALRRAGEPLLLDSPRWRGSDEERAYRAWWRGLFLKVRPEGDGWVWSVRMIGRHYVAFVDAHGACPVGGEYAAFADGGCPKSSSEAKAHAEEAARAHLHALEEAAS